MDENLESVEVVSAVNDGELAVNANVVQTDCPCMRLHATQDVAEQPRQTNKSDIYFERCEDVKCCTLEDTFIESQGRILEVATTVRDVCPGKRVSVGVTISEIDASGTAHPRGMKIFLLEPHRNPNCMDLLVPSARFILPEELATTHSSSTCTNRRHFVVRVDAHYSDVNGGFCTL